MVIKSHRVSISGSPPRSGRGSNEDCRAGSALRPNVLRCVFGEIAGLPRSRPFTFMRRYEIAASTNIRLPTSKHFGNNDWKYVIVSGFFAEPIPHTIRGSPFHANRGGDKWILQRNR